MAGKAKPYLSSGLIALGAVGVLALYTGNRWLAPLTPLILGAAAVLPLSVIGALLLHAEARSAPSRFLTFGLAAALAAIIGVGLPALWTQPALRARATALTDVVDLGAALDDPAGPVQVAACTQIFAGPTDTEEITRMLEGRPKLAKACLPKVAEGARRTITAGNLERRWQDRLVAEEAGAGQCVLSDALATLPTELGSRQARLLDCALRARSKDQRVCCAQSLAGLADSCAKLAGSIDAQELIRSGSSSLLLALSYDNDTAVREHKELVDRVDLSCAKMRMIGVQVACISLDPRGARGDEAEVLRWLVEGHDDCLSQAERDVDPGLADTCSALMDRVAKTGSLDEASICSSQQEVARERLAYIEKVEGLTKEESDALTVQIAAGDAAAQEHDMTYESLIAAMQGKQGAPSLDSYTDADKRKIMAQMRARAKSPQELVQGSMKNLDSIQAAFGAKLAGSGKLDKALEETEGAPSMDKVDQEVKERRKKIDKLRGRLDGEVAKAKAKTDKKENRQKKQKLDQQP